MKHLLFRTYLISGLFIAILAFPFLNDRFHFILDIPAFENRKLSEKPVMDPNRLDPYPMAFENYYNDTFALRSRIIRCFNLYNIVLLKKTPFPDEIIIGKNNWLFHAGIHINAYLGKDRPTEKQLFELKEEFERKQKYLQSKNCRFYVMITPGKPNIYPENLPHTYKKLNAQGWGEEVISYMNKNSTVHMIDLFAAFRKIKDKYPLYYHGDLHWNYIGGFQAANVAIDKMSKDIPGLSPLMLSDFNITTKPLGVGDISRMVGNLEMYLEMEYVLAPVSGFRATELPKQAHATNPEFVYPWDYERVREIKGSNKPRLLIFSDSFGDHVFPFLSENFSRTVKIFEGWDYVLHKEIVEKEKPDVVLLMIYEPFIKNVLNHLTE